MTEVSDVALKRTQDSLGKIIKKPVLTDKLLRKPPFKFLHDIIRAVINTTGFIDGLYTEEELQSENIKDRDAKIEFLQKAIDTLKIATKQEVRARPSKIVAGLESEKTSEFLLAIGKAIDRKIDSTEAVTLVKSGNINSPQRKEPKQPKSQIKTDSRKTSKDNKEPTVKKAKNNLSSDKKLQKDSNSNAKIIKQSSKDSAESKKHKTKSQTNEKGKDNKKDREKKQSQKQESAKNIATSEEREQNDRNIEIPQMNGNIHDVIENGNMKPNSAKLETIEKQETLPNVEPGIQMEMQENLEQNDKNVKHSASPKNELPEKTKEFETENQPPRSALSVGELPPETATSEQPPAAAIQEKTSTEKPRSSKSKRNHGKNELEKTSDVVSSKPDEKLKSSKSLEKVERSMVPTSKTNEDSKTNSKPPRTALRSAAVRPVSARPSAPRRRDKNVRQILHTESFVQDTIEQNKSNKKNILPDFDDADNIVITETIPDNISSVDEITTNHLNDAEIDGKQGHLVQQILDTQTTILKSDTKNDAAISDESILNDRKSITRNMTELRKMIQKLSLYITPLGKMMEYFQEDVDTMQIELMMWQKAGTAAEADIKEEQRHAGYSYCGACAAFAYRQVSPAVVKRVFILGHPYDTTYLLFM